MNLKPRQPRSLRSSINTAAPPVQPSPVEVSRCVAGRQYNHRNVLVLDAVAGWWTGGLLAVLPAAPLQSPARLPQLCPAPPLLDPGTTAPLWPRPSLTCSSFVKHSHPTKWACDSSHLWKRWTSHIYFNKSAINFSVFRTAIGDGGRVWRLPDGAATVGLLAARLQPELRSALQISLKTLLWVGIMRKLPDTAALHLASPIVLLIRYSPTQQR